MQNTIRAHVVDVVSDDFGVDFIHHFLERARRDNPILKERLDRVPAF